MGLYQGQENAHGQGLELTPEDRMGPTVTLAGAAANQDSTGSGARNVGQDYLNTAAII